MTVGAGPDPDRAEVDELGWQLHLATKALDGRPYTAPEVFVSSLRDVVTAAEPLLAECRSLAAELAVERAKVAQLEAEVERCNEALTKLSDSSSELRADHTQLRHSLTIYKAEARGALVLRDEARAERDVERARREAVEAQSQEAREQCRCSAWERAQSDEEAKT